MKYLIILLFTTLISFISCTKTYTCTCTEYFNGTDTSWNKFKGVNEIKAKKEEDASSTCSAQGGTPQTFAGNEYGLSCSLN